MLLASVGRNRSARMQTPGGVDGQRGAALPGQPPSSRREVAGDDVLDALRLEVADDRQTHRAAADHDGGVAPCDVAAPHGVQGDGHGFGQCRDVG
ncbi:hypothetical protein AWB99_22265 [Mycolicibacterium confluentis]|nr:hypothetical protein AWB99_22265 [Mycolicibacterium confluentis]